MDPAGTFIENGLARIRLNSLNLLLQTRAHSAQFSSPQISDHYFFEDFELAKGFQGIIDFPILFN
jgi:hypothetical protein